MLTVLTKYFQDTSVLRRLLFAVSVLNPDLPMYWETVLEFATSGQLSKTSVTADQVKCLIENLQLLDQKAFDTDLALHQELILFAIPGKKPVGCILISPETNCVICGSQLMLRKDRHSTVVIYDSRLGTIPGAHYHKLCTGRACNVIQHFGYYTIDGCVLINTGWKLLPYFGSSRETFFSIDILSQMDAGVLIGQLSFKQIADIYNYTHGCSLIESRDTLLSRQRLDRRRIEDAYMQYAVLQVHEWYPSLSLKSSSFHDGLHDLLLTVTPQFHGSFIKRNAGHRCSVPGCGQVIVLDGNMKNSREVCYATDAGYLQFSNLPGKIKTGCPNTPAYRSRYCAEHIQCIRDDSDSSKIPAIIIDKRVTRSSVSYQVVWLGKPTMESTWEAKESLPEAIVLDFEKAIEVQIHKKSFESGGQTINTLSLVRTGEKSLSQQNKRHRIDTLDLESDSSGSFVLPEDLGIPNLSCRTEKDTHARLNHRTAGILAGIHPCGVITMLGELFGAESKGQVYGQLYSYLSVNETSTQSINTVCYDDACHLLKYAKNKVRSSLTPTAEQMSKMNYVVDRMHFRGHKDQWCRENCDPDKLEIMKGVNSEVCEQTFSWLSRYARITRHMNREHFLFFMLYVSELHNRSIKTC